MYYRKGTLFNVSDIDLDFSESVIPMIVILVLMVIMSLLPSNDTRDGGLKLSRT